MKSAVLALHQQRADALRPHGLHLVGDTGHKDGTVAVLFEPRAGGSAVVVDDFMALGGDHRLFAVVGGRLAAGAGKVAGDLVPLGLIEGQLIPEAGGNGLLGQVVCRGAEAAGKDQQVAAALSLVDEIGQTAMVVADGALPLDRDAQIGQLPAEVLGVGVEDVAEKELGTHTDDLCCHGSTLEFHVVGDTQADALGGLCGLGFQLCQTGHPGLGFEDLAQFGADLRVRRGKDGAAVLIGQDARLEGVDVSGRLDDLGLVHADEGAEDGQVLGGVGTLQSLDGLAGHLCQALAGDEGFTALLPGDDVGNAHHAAAHEDGEENIGRVIADILLGLGIRHHKEVGAAGIGGDELGQSLNF